MKTERVLKKNAIRAYKSFNSDLTCKGFQYEVGKEYHHKGALELCKSGFHACPKIVNCFNYYPFDKMKTRVAEVLVWGKVEYKDGVKYEDAGVKLCASNIKVVRELTWNEVLSLCNTGNSNSGDRNSGDFNSGDRNSGDFNSGDRNSGSCNTGYSNSGNWNSGDWNIGNRNSGSCNTGYSNSGNRNSGNWNSGNWNSGDWNSGDWNSGYLNTSAQKYTFIFNKRVEKSVLERAEFPSFMFFALTEWVPARNMSQVEKERHPEYVTTGGYLKKYAYKTAFRKSFKKARRKPDWPKQRQMLLDLPNFDAKIFEEISGITPEELEL